MKRFVLLITAIIALAACVRENLPKVNCPVVGEGEVLVEASIVVPAMQDTRSFAAPAVSSLHLLVFDENDCLIQVSEAIPVDSFGAENNTEYKFRVRLGQSNLKRTVHLIANSPITINDDGTSDYILGEQERRVINTLYTQGDNEAYWACVEFENGIIGEQITSSDGKQVFVPSEELSEALTKVPMVRNYTRVKLTNNTSLIDPEIMMMNVPDRGSVAPIINDGIYASFANREGSSNTPLGYDAISEQGYDGYEPAGTTYSNTEFATQHEFYERHQQTGGKTVANPLFAIIRGKIRTGGGYGGQQTYYYKIDLCYLNEATGAVELYNLLRNVEYNIVITEVLGNGYSTIEEAVASAAINNINFAVETKNLSNISDGECRLSLEYTQRVLTEGDALFTLKYKYETNVSTGATNNSAVTFSNLTGDILAVNNAYGANDAAKYIVSNVAGSDGWNTVTFKTQPIHGTKLQTIILTAGNLKRSVELILGEPYIMELDMVPGSAENVVKNEVGTSIEAKITLPLGLPKIIFPLEIYLVAEKMSLSPDATMNILPVVMGLNYQGVPTTGGTYFGYEITVQYENYFNKDANGNDTYNNVISLYFKTSLADSSSDVYAYSPYFEIATDSFVAQ